MNLEEIKRVIDLVYGNMNSYSSGKTPTQIDVKVKAFVNGTQVNFDIDQLFMSGASNDCILVGTKIPLAITVKENLESCGDHDVSNLQSTIDLLNRKVKELEDKIKSNVKSKPISRRVTKSTKDPK